MESGEPAACVATPGDGKRTSSPEEPGAAVPLGDVFRSAQFNDSVFLDPRRSDSDDGDAVLGDDEDEAEFSDDDEIYDTDSDDSEIEFEEDDGDDPDLELEEEEEEGICSTDVTVVPVEFLGTKARFASVGNTAGFMLLGAFPADQSGHLLHHEIAVHYRYARFTTSDDSGGGVELCGGGGKLHTVRFLVPSCSHAAFAFADPASSLRLAGAALADMAYPRGFTAQLQKLWSNLVAAAPVRVPPWAARLEVTVSAGILLIRPRDRTPERMASMRAALAAEPRVRPSLRGVGVVVSSLPAPVMSRADDEDDVVRSAKRRRFDEEECAICYEALERGLVAWPRCAHVFHGACLERLLVRGDQRCPLCRTELNGAPGQRVNAC